MGGRAKGAGEERGRTEKMCVTVWERGGTGRWWAGRAEKEEREERESESESERASEREENFCEPERGGERETERGREEDREGDKEGERIHRQYLR